MKQTLIDASIYQLPQTFQGQIPACDAFGIAKYIQLLIFRQTGKIVNISQRWIYANCVQDGMVGLRTKDVLDFGMRVGFCTSDLIDENVNVPESQYRILQVTSQMLASAAQYKIGGYVEVNPDIDSIWQSLYYYSAVIGSIPMGNFSQTMVLPPMQGSGNGLHSALIFGIIPAIGMNDNIILWDNWWGSFWGNGGYGTFLWSQFRDRINQLYSINKLIISPMQNFPKIDAWCAAIQEFEGWTQNPPSHSFRNHNPGNIRYVTGGRYSVGAKPDAQGFNIYPDYATGLLMLKTLLTRACMGQSSSYKPTMSLIEFYNVYAPSYDHNNPNEYANFVASKLGVPPTTHIGTFVT